MCRPFGMAILPTTYFMDMCWEKWRTGPVMRLMSI
jgi:hypothetical protein